jgi:hypothetical protein
MTTLTYDLCLLITTKKEAFGVVSMQTDDTLFLASDEFVALEDSELQKAQLTAKPRDKLSAESSLMFNRCTITICWFHQLGGHCDHSTVLGVWCFILFVQKWAEGRWLSTC